MVYELLKKLSDAHGVSGFEDNIKDIIRKELAGHVDEFREDSLGNLIAVRKGSDFSVMIASHMDEIGMMVQYIDEKGFIKFVGIANAISVEEIREQGKASVRLINILLSKMVFVFRSFSITLKFGILNSGHSVTIINASTSTHASYSSFA